MKKVILLATVALALGYAACNRADDPEPDSSRIYRLDLPDTVYTFYGFNTIENNVATLGRVLFYERQLSVNNSVSCGTCHKQNYAFADNTALSAGFENRLTHRNTPAIQDIRVLGGFSTPLFFWDGRENNIQDLIARPVSSHVEMGMPSLDAALPRLQALSYYKPLFRKAFGDSIITSDRVSRAMVSFIQAIRTGSTRFDGSFDVPLSALELEGEHLFGAKYNCESCHRPNFGGYSGSEFMNIGLEATATDAGRAAITSDPNDAGAFKIPNLRNVALTAPYMHDGRFATLEEVLEHYSHGIQPSPTLDARLKIPTGEPMRMNITAHEKAAIIAFLHTLTDYEMISNTNFSDPFKVK